MSVPVVLAMLLETSWEAGFRLALLLVPCPTPHQDSPSAPSHPQRRGQGLGSPVELALLRFLF